MHAPRVTCWRKSFRKKVKIHNFWITLSDGFPACFVETALHVSMKELLMKMIKKRSVTSSWEISGIFWAALGKAALCLSEKVFRQKLLEEFYQLESVCGFSANIFGWYCQTKTLRAQRNVSRKDFLKKNTNFSLFQDL